MAARLAVNSVRRYKQSLMVPLDPKKAQAASQKLAGDPLINGQDGFLATADRRKLRDWALGGHGGMLDEKLSEFAARQAEQAGRVPKTDVRYLQTVSPALLAAQPSQLYDEIRNDLLEKGGQWQNANPEEVRHQTARAMVLARDAADPIPRPVDEAQLERNAQKLQTTPAFQKMFNDLGTAGVMGKMVEGQASLVTAYGQAAQQLKAPAAEQPGPQPQVGVVQQGPQQGPQGPQYGVNH